MSLSMSEGVGGLGSFNYLLILFCCFYSSAVVCLFL